MYRILVTSRTFSTTSNEPRQILENANCQIIQSPIMGTHSEEQLIPLVSDVDGMIIGMDKVTERVINAAPKLKVISVHATGTDHVNVKYATEKGIIVTNTPGANSSAVAELALALMFNLARKVLLADHNTKAGGWENFTGIELWNKNLGIVGLGRIGQELAVRAKGLSMNILPVDISRDGGIAESLGLYYVNFEEMLQQSDFIVLCVPLTEQTRGMIGKREFSLMKPSTYLINVARGALVDEKALYEALTNQQIAGAALDAFENEPPQNSPLLRLNNIITTPHIGAFTKEAVTRVSLLAAQNLADGLLGNKPKFLVIK